MTDAAPRRRPSAFPVVAAGLASFLAVLTFLGIRVKTGHDPALGPAVAQTQTPAPRRVLVRRVEERRVLITLKPPKEAVYGGSGGAPAQQAAVSASPPAAEPESTPAPSAAPTPAPSPSPSPPVATRSS